MNILTKIFPIRKRKSATEPIIRLEQKRTNPKALKLSKKTLSRFHERWQARCRLDASPSRKPCKVNEATNKQFQASRHARITAMRTSTPKPIFE